MMIRTRDVVMKLCLHLILASICLGAGSQELNTVLMNSTFEITGPSTSIGKTTFGTVFLMGKPQAENPKQGYNVLITAAHVLNEISGDDAVLALRRRNDKGMFDRFNFPVKIRSKGANLYVTNSEADVAAMYIPLPTEVDLRPLPIKFLADDTMLERIEVHPGDELLCLGFPLAADFHGFPILRTGTLASYPVTPYKIVQQYLFTFHVFPGNSGGPVYFSFPNRVYGGGGTHIGVVQGVIGLVSQQESSGLPEYKNLPLDIAVIVPSSYIRDTIALLPEKP